MGGLDYIINEKGVLEQGELKAFLPWPPRSLGEFSEGAIGDRVG